MTANSKRSLELFKKLCGESAYPNAAVLTTMWAADEHSLEFTKQLLREEQLRDDYLLDILAEGGLLLRVKSRSPLSIDESSAKDVFAELFNSWKDDKITLAIQHELVNNSDATLDRTAAGKLLSLHMEELSHLYESQLSEIKGSLREGTTEAQEEVEDLRKQSKEIGECLVNIRRDRQSIQLSLLEIHSKERDRIVNEIGNLQQRWRDDMKEREREQRHRERILLGLLQVDGDRRTLQSQEQAAQIERYEAELEKVRIEIATMRQTTDAKLDAAQKAKKAWVGPLLQGVASGGLALGQFYFASRMYSGDTAS